MDFNTDILGWTREPEQYRIGKDKIEIVTMPQTDLWQRTYSFTQMRVCHMWEGAGKIKFGIYACSPEQSTFKAVFTNMQITECMWKAHDGQAPDME